jgi:hypothetical protein
MGLLATHLSLHLARFDGLTTVASGIDASRLPGVLYCGVGADHRSAATEPSSRQAYTFAILGLHEDAESARTLLGQGRELAPWLAGAREVWTGLLRPFRHRGAVNYLSRAAPGLILEDLGPVPEPITPLVAMTSIGWNLDGLDMDRVRRFAVGSVGVRSSMTAVPGLRAQHSFFIDGGFAQDLFTVSFWRDEASLNAFAYGPGVHRDQVAVLRDNNLADRTSFTRLTVLEATGTWMGSDPLVSGSP